MEHKLKILVTASLVFLAACSGGDKAAPVDSSEVTGVDSVNGSEPSISLDLDIDEGVGSVSSTPDVDDLFKGFSSDPSKNNEEPKIGEDDSREELIFKAPQNCLTTPTGGSTEQFIEALHRNCLYRPFDGSNQHWVKQIDVEGKDREWVRDVGFYRSEESQCLLGEAYQDRCADDENEIFDTITEYKIVCTSDMVAPNDRIAQRLNAVCPNTVIEE